MRPAAVTVVTSKTLGRPPVDPLCGNERRRQFFACFDFLVPIACSQIYTTYMMTSGMMGGAIRGKLPATLGFVASPRVGQPASDPALVCRSQASSKALLDWMVANGAPKQAGASQGSPLTGKFSASSVPSLDPPASATFATSCQ